MKRSIAVLIFALAMVSLGAAQNEPKEPVAKPAESTPASLDPAGGAKKADPVVEQEPAKTKPAPTLPVLTVAEILKRNRAANGSTLTASKITSVVATGTFEITAMGSKGTLAIYSKAPNKQLTEVNLPGFGLILDGYDGTEAWSQDPISGLRVKSGVELAQSRAAAVFDRDAQLEKLYPQMTAKGTANVNGHDAYVIEATSPDTGTETWYFDAQSFLLIRQDSVADSPQGKIPLQSYLEDYRLVGGIKMPFLTRQTNPSYSVTLTITEFKINAPIDDAKFKKPVAP